MIAIVSAGCAMVCVEEFKLGMFHCLTQCVILLLVALGKLHSDFFDLVRLFPPAVQQIQQTNFRPALYHGCTLASLSQLEPHLETTQLNIIIMMTAWMNSQHKVLSVSQVLLIASQCHELETGLPQVCWTILRFMGAQYIVHCPVHCTLPSTMLLGTLGC